METQLDLQPARILIADDHPAMAKGIQSELAPYPHVAVVAMVPTFEAVLPALAQTPIDIVLLDLGNMGSSPLQMMDLLTRTYPMVCVIVYSSTIDLAPEMLAAGARGYVAKDDPFRQLIQAIAAVGQDQQYVSDKVQAYLQRRTTTLDDISPRELIVLKLLTEGLSNEAIAQQIGVDRRTVQNRITILRQKTLCHERIELANWYRRMFYGTANSML